MRNFNLNLQRKTINCTQLLYSYQIRPFPAEKKEKNEKKVSRMNFEILKKLKKIQKTKKSEKWMRRRFRPV